MEEKYLRVPEKDELYTLISKWIYCRYSGSCSVIRKLDNSIEFQDLINDCYISLEKKSLRVCRIKSYVGSFLSNRITKLNKRKNVEHTIDFLNSKCVVNLTSAEFYNEFAKE